MCSLFLSWTRKTAQFALPYSCPFHQFSFCNKFRPFDADSGTVSTRYLTANHCTCNTWVSWCEFRANGYESAGRLSKFPEIKMNCLDLVYPFLLLNSFQVGFPRDSYLFVRANFVPFCWLLYQYLLYRKTIHCIFVENWKLVISFLLDFWFLICCTKSGYKQHFIPISQFHLNLWMH